MKDDVLFYSRKRQYLQEEIAELDLRIETFTKLNEHELIFNFKKEKQRLETTLRKVIKKEKELNETNAKE